MFTPGRTLPPWFLTSLFALGVAVTAIAVEPNWSNLAISEIYYHPPTTNVIDGDEYEFIELINNGTTPLDLQGVSFGGITAVIGYSRVLGPGQCAVLVANPARFAERFPGVEIAGAYTGRLDNAGETIRLFEPSGGMITSVSYRDEAPWPTQADGAGPSLQRVNRSPNASASGNWTAAPPTPGVPTAPELTDTDGDGMPDVWELAHGFDIEDRADASGDADGDLLNNVGEYLAGTDPHNADDCLRFTSVNFEQTPSFRIVSFTFSAMANRSYSLFQQVGEDECWNSVEYFGAQPTNRVVTVRRIINPTTVPIPMLFHLASPGGPPPPCDDGSD